MLGERRTPLAGLTVWAACYYCPMKYLVTLLMIFSLVACSSEPTVTKSEFDATVTDLNVIVTNLNKSLEKEQNEIAELKSNVVILSEDIANLKELARVKEYPVTVEEGFKDIFDKATKVDRFTAKDVMSCAAESSYEASAGDIITVEIAFARHEDSESHSSGIYEHLSVIYPNVEGFKEKRHFQFRDVRWPSKTTEDSPHVNWWMKNEDDSPSIVEVYRGIVELEKPVSAKYIDDTRAPGEGEYKVIFREPDRECYRAVAPWRLDDVIPNSILVAWYVE